jgi:uncharacterized protein (TIGR02246 family)
MGSGEPTVLQPSDEPPIAKSDSWVRPVVWLVAVGLMGLPLITGPSPKGKGDEAEARAIGEVLRRQEAAWNQGDVEGFLRNFAKSPRLVFASGNEVSTGWRNALDSYRETYGDAVGTGHLSLDVLQIEPLGRAYAKALGRWTVTHADTAPAEGLFTVILKKEPEGWVVIHDHTSQEEPPSPGQNR